MSRNDLPNENASNFSARLRETLQTMLGRRGDKLDRVVTLRDLNDSGLATIRPGAVVGEGPVPLNPGPNANPPYVQDLTPPPAPTGISVVTSGNSIQVTVNPQTYRAGNGPGKVTVYGAKYMLGDALPTFTNAAILDEFPGDVHAFPVDPAALYRIWVKSVSRDGVPSEPAGGVNGIQPVPGLLDDLSIANLTASRIRSGSVTVGQFIQAANYVPGVNGWRINGDGTAEFSGVAVRGAVYANAGLIGGITIASNAVRAGQSAYDTGQGFYLGSDGRFSLGNSAGNRLTWDGTDLNVFGGGTFSGALSAATGTFAGNVSGGNFTTGAFTGYAWPPAGAGNIGSYLGPGGLLIGNANNGKYLQVTSDGNIYTPGFNVENGVMTVTQANVINTLNIAGQAVTVPIGVSSNSTITWADTLEKTLLSATINPQGGSVVIMADFTISSGSTDAAGTAPQMTVRIKRDGVALRTLTSLGGRETLSWVDSGPIFGEVTYALTVTADTAAIFLSSSAGVRSMAVFGAKR